MGKELMLAERMLADALVLCANHVLTAVKWEIDNPNTTSFRMANLVPSETVAIFAVRAAGYTVTLKDGAYVIVDAPDA